MSKKIKILIAAGGTGGHVFPGSNLAAFLIKKNYSVKLALDKRGYKYLDNLKKFDISILPSSPLESKNFFKLLKSFILVSYSVVRSLVFLMLNRPTLIFGMGGYASFPICFAANLLRIKFIIYENNLILGKANKYLLPFAQNIIVSSKNLEGISNKYNNKIIEIGNIIKKNIIDYSRIKKNKLNFTKLNILILGGSQAAKVFAESLPNIFLQCSKNLIPIKIYQHCLPSQNENLKLFYEKHKIEFEIFNFKNDLIEYFTKVNLAITRSGSSVLAELTNANIPFISVPLPSSADNHQLKNAIYYQNKNYSFLIEEKDLNDKLFYLIKDIYENNTLINKIFQNQRQHSDKNVYDNINQLIEKITYDKN